MSDIKSMVRLHRLTIERCIQEPTIVAHLVGSVISDDAGQKIKNLYTNDSPRKATEELMKQVFKSEAPEKWKFFVEALEKAEYTYLAKLIQTDSRPQQDYEHERRMIQIFCPKLEERVNAEEIVDKLYSLGVINSVDRSEIFIKLQTKGNIYAIIVLLDRMQCRQPPDIWYNVFLNALKETGYSDIVTEMETISLSNASPDAADTCVSFSRTSRSEASPPAAVDRDVCDSSTMENVLTDYWEAERSTGNLNKPPRQPSRPDSIVSSSSLQQDEKTEEFAEPNVDLRDIELEMTQHSTADSSNLVEKGFSDSKHEGTMVDDSSEDENCYEDDAPRITLRKDQLEIAENALAGRNTIICSGTNTGKTYVAFHVIEKHLQQSTNGPRKVAFMARTGALIKQQADKCKKQFRKMFKIKLLLGDDEESTRMSAFLVNNDILFFTPKILVNNLESGNIKSLAEFSLLVLDECHHTKASTPYYELMVLYLMEKEKSSRVTALPQILGLTATLGVGKSRNDEEAVEHILKFCARLDVKQISTVRRNLDEYMKHVTNRKEEIIKMKKQTCDPCRSVLLEAIQETERHLKGLVAFQPKLIDLVCEKMPRDKESQAYGKWADDIIKVASLNDDQTGTSRNISTCAKYLMNYNAALEMNALLRTVDVVTFLSERNQLEYQQKDKLTREEKQLLDKLNDVQQELMGITIENPNVRILSNKLRTLVENDEESRAMVFVKARATCRSLAKFLHQDLEDIGVRTSPLYGKAALGFQEGMKEAEQTDILDKFREGYFAVIVATSVGVEGIDVPACNVVLNYNYSRNEITKIQMEGRSRKQDGSTITMGNEKILEEEEVNAYKALRMQRAMELVQYLPPKQAERDILTFQKQEIKKIRYQKAVERAQVRHKTKDDFELRCCKCKQFACYASDIRTLLTDHFVIDKQFAEKIDVKPHKAPNKYNGLLHKKFKMYCKKCPTDWGQISITQKGGLTCRIIKLSSFIFVNRKNREKSSFKTWREVPYKVEEITAEDLPRLLGDLG